VIDAAVESVDSTAARGNSRRLSDTRISSFAAAAKARRAEIRSGRERRQGGYFDSRCPLTQSSE